MTYSLPLFTNNLIMMMFSKSCPVKHSSSIASRFHRQYGHANLEHSSMCSIEGSTGSKDAVDSNEWEYDVDIPSASQPTTLPIKIPLPSRSASSRRNEMQEIEEMTEMYDERTWQMYYRISNARAERTRLRQKGQ